MSDLTFRADAETLRILERVGLEKKDDFINRAVQSYATTGGAFDYAAGKVKPSSSMSLSSDLAAGYVSAGTSAAGASAGSAAINSSDPVTQLNAEVERLLGAGSGVTASLAQGNPQMVEFFNRGQKIANLELSECQSILKSLRPPISFAEVIEMLTLMSVS